MLRRAGKVADLESLQADREHAQRLAKLAATASARGAAPLPPGKGGSAPKPAAPAAAPAKVVKYRCIEDYKSDEIEVNKGATVFIVGDPVDDMGQGVAGGKNGKISMKCLALITPELLEAERKQQEKEIEEARAAEEEALRQEMEQLKVEHAQQAQTTGGDDATPAAKDASQAAYEKELEEKFESERQALLDEELRLKEEAARIEAMLKELED
jgi:hypothetical protein